MRKSSIRTHLKPYSIHGRRSTTIHHAFASAMAPLEAYDSDRVDSALRFLGYDPDEPIHCFYCQYNEAQTWDHLEALVKDKRSSGFGHTLSNLVPACRDCNSRKGNRPFAEFLSDKPQLVSLLEKYQQAFSPADMSIFSNEVVTRLLDIKRQILDLMKEADAVLDARRNDTC